MPSRGAHPAKSRWSSRTCANDLGQPWIDHIRLTEMSYGTSLQTETYRKLHDFYFRDEGSCENVSISDGLTISVDETHTIKETPFRLGAISGRDFSGWVGADLIRQCAEALERKSGIGTRVRSEYDQFWLAVGSNLTLGDRTEYVPLLIENLPKQSVFDKLLLIDANSPDRSIAIDLPW